MRGATERSGIRNDRRAISTHAPHAGSDFVLFEICSRFSNFNPRSPCGERHRHADFHLDAAGFQPTLPMRGATRWAKVLRSRSLISTHAPHAGSDETGQMKSSTSAIFQPTLPMRGATLASACTAASNAHFNPRSPCGERLSSVVGAAVRPTVFQPTLPMRGATVSGAVNPGSQTDFNPRSPCGERRGICMNSCTA